MGGCLARPGAAVAGRRVVVREGHGVDTAALAAHKDAIGRTQMPQAGVPGGPPCRRTSPVRSSVASCAYSAVSSAGTQRATLSRATAADW